VRAGRAGVKYSSLGERATTRLVRAKGLQRRPEKSSTNYENSVVAALAVRSTKTKKRKREQQHNDEVDKIPRKIV